jgi:hypothetical protein
MRLLIFALMLAGLSTAFNVTPDFLDVQYTGSESLPVMDIDLTIDCDTKDLIIDVKDSETEERITGMDTVLFYTDYGYQPLPTPKTTDSEGRVVMQVPGTLDFLTGLFILRVDKQGYRTIEIEFLYEKCFEPAPEQEEDEPEEETPPANDTPPVVMPPPNDTEPVNETPPLDTSPPANVTEEPGQEETAFACPLGILLLSLLIFKVRK